MDQITQVTQGLGQGITPQPIPTQQPSQPAQPSGMPTPQTQTPKKLKPWIFVALGVALIVIGAAVYYGKSTLYPGAAKLPPIGGGGGGGDAAANCGRIKNALQCGLTGQCQWNTQARICEPAAGRGSGSGDGGGGNQDAQALMVAQQRAERAARAASQAAKAAEDAAQQANTQEASDAAAEARRAADTAGNANLTAKNAQSVQAAEQAATEAEAAQAIAVTAQGRAEAALTAKQEADQAAAEAAAAAAAETAAAVAAFSDACKNAQGTYDADNKVCDLGFDIIVAFADRATLPDKIVERDASKNNKSPLEKKCENVGAIKEMDGRQVCAGNDGKNYILDADGELQELPPDNPPGCPAETPVSFEGQCYVLANLCAELTGELQTEFEAEKINAGQLQNAAQEINNQTGCNINTGQIVSNRETKKAKEECNKKDQAQWEWDDGNKQCKDKAAEAARRAQEAADARQAETEARLRAEVEARARTEADLNNMRNQIADLQQLLKNAQSDNNSADIAALTQQIAALTTQLNKQNTAAAASAPAPAQEPAVVAVVTPKEAEKQKEAQKNKSKTAGQAIAAIDYALPAAASGSASAQGSQQTAAQPASGGNIAAADSGTAAGSRAAASTSTAASSAASADATRRVHGAYIQGRTGPGILIYPFALAGANGLYYLLRRRRRKQK